MNNTIRIGIIDPHDIVRQSLKIFLETTHDLLFVGEASSESEIFSMCWREKPDVVLFDFLQTDAQGLKLIASLHCVFPTLYIIILTTVMTPQFIIQALLTGAVGYFYKQVDIDTLADAIRAAAKGKTVFDEEVQTILRAQAPTQVWVSAGVN